MSVVLNIVSAFDEKGIKKAQKAFAQLETTTQKASYALKTWGGPAATAAIGAVTTELVRAVKAAAEDQKSQEQLKIALENTVGANQQQVAAVEDSVTALMYQTATADDALRPALAKLVRATGDVTQAQSLLKLALDVSAGSGRDLTSVSTALSRAALGNFTALTRLGIPLDQNAVKAKDLDGVLGSLASSFAGAASKNAQTFQGQMTTLKIAIGELEESVGMKLIPVLSDYASVLLDITTKGQSVDKSTKTWIDRIATGIGFLARNTPALGPTLKALGFINDKIKEQADYLKRIQGPTSNVTKNLKGLTIATVDETKATDKSNSAKDKAAAAAKKHAAALAKAKEAAAAYKKEIQDLAQVIKDGLNARLDEAKDKLKTAQDVFDNYAKSVGSAVTEAFNFGDAQSEAAGNAANLQSALAKQAEAQRKVNERQALWNDFKSLDNTAALAEANRDLADATAEVSAAQAKPQTFFDTLAKQADKAKKFGELVSRLIAGGLSETALSQVLAAGVDGGTAIATEILDSADGILKANTLTQSMTDLADQMGKKAAGKYYQAGVNSATSFLKGIQDTVDKVDVILANPNLSMTDIINAGFAGMTEQQLADFQTQLQIDLQGVNFGMGTLMADGGIVTRATSIVAGEAGAEAIIPLDRMGDFGMGGGTNVTIHVNGGDPNAVVAALRTYMLRNGSVPITVSG